MAVTFKNRAITAANIRSIGGELNAGLGFFKDGDLHYVVMERSSFRMEVVRRTAAITFTDTALSVSATHPVIINGNYFECGYASAGKTGCYGAAFVGGAFSPADVDSVGAVIDNGVQVLPDAKSGASYAHLVRSAGSDPSYSVGMGNPPSGVFEGMGGLGPMILKNPVTGKTLPIGVGNVYGDPKKKGIPQTPQDFQDIEQRNNNTYRSINAATAGGDGVCVVAFRDASPRILIVVVKPHNQNGNLDQIRDKLLDAGMDGAVFTDGSNSTTLVANGQVVFAPAGYKNNLIEVGIGFRFIQPKVKLRVRFKQLTVKNDHSIFGKGLWDLQCLVNGAKAGDKQDVEVTDSAGEAGNVVALGFEHVLELDPSKGERLELAVKGSDEAGLDENLATAERQFDAFAQPAFGVGSHTIESADFAVDVDIEQL